MGMRGSSGGHREPRTRSLLVIGQLTMATVLLVGAGLLAHSFVRLMRTDLGYTTRNILEFQLLLPDTYDVPKRAGYVTAMLERLRAIPGVAAAGFSRHGVLITEELHHRHVRAARPDLEEMRKETLARVRSVSSGLHHRARDANAARPRLPRQRRGDRAAVVVMNRSAAAQVLRRGRGCDSAVDRTGLSRRPASNMRSLAWSTTSGNEEQPARESKPEVFVDYRQMIDASRATRTGPPVTNEAAIGWQSFAIGPRAIRERYVPPCVTP